MGVVGYNHDLQSRMPLSVVSPVERELEHFSELTSSGRTQTRGSTQTITSNTQFPTRRVLAVFPSAKKAAIWSACFPSRQAARSAASRVRPPLWFNCTAIVHTSIFWSPLSLEGLPNSALVFLLAQGLLHVLLAAHVFFLAQAISGCQHAEQNNCEAAGQQQRARLVRKVLAQAPLAQAPLARRSRAARAKRGQAESGAHRAPSDPKGSNKNRLRVLLWG